MLFSSVEFLYYFLPVTLILYFAVPFKLKNLVLLVASLFFYFYGEPIYMLMMFMFFTVWGLFAGMLSAISKDFLNLVKSLTQAIFWMSGIIYNVNSIDIPWIRAILSYNPVTIVASGYRHCFIDKTWFFDDLYSVRCYAIVLVIMIIGAIWAYKKLYKDIPDVM